MTPQVLHIALKVSQLFFIALETFEILPTVATSCVELIIHNTRTWKHNNGELLVAQVLVQVLDTRVQAVYL